VNGGRIVSKAKALLFIGGALALLVSGCAPRGSENNAALLKLKGQCQEAGAKARSEWVAKYHGETFSDEPEYAYNATLNTCLYADSYTDNETNLFAKLAGATHVEVRFVLDVYSNKTLIEYTAYDGKAISGSPSEATFEAEKRRLMSGH
jgi:hypothetical protein